MKNKAYFWAGLIGLFTALLHTVGGQIELVNPMLDGNMTAQMKTEWLGAWHMVTILLWVFGFILFKNGRQENPADRSLIQVIGWLSFLFGICFILASIYQGQHAPQYILIWPVALLIYFGLKKNQTATN